MFNNNRKTRRRFRLGNLARLVQLRQSVSHQPPQPLPPSSPTTLEEILSNSPPQSPSFQPQPLQTQSPSIFPSPNQLSSPMPSPSTLPPSSTEAGENRQYSPRVPPETKLSPRSPTFQHQPQSPSNQFSSMTPSPSTLPPPFSESSENSRSPSPELELSPRSPTFQPKLPQQPQSLQPQLKPPPSPPKPGESQTPLSPPSTQNATLESQSQSSPPLPPSKTIDGTLFPSPPPSQPLPPSFSESGETQPLLKPPETKTPPSPPFVKKPLTLNANEESQSKALPPVSPSKFNNETLPRSPPPSQLSSSNSGESQPPDLPPLTAEAKTPQSPPPLPPSKSTNETLFRSPPSPPISSQPPPSLSPKASKNLQSQSSIRSIPPPPSPSTLTTPSQTLKPSPPSSPKPQVHQTGPQTSTRIADKVNKKNRGNAFWSEKQKPEPIMMFVNSNVQGFNTSLSLHSSSIDHDPGVHLTIDYDQTW